MRRLCLFSGGLALAAALYVYAVHAAPWPLLLGLAVLCGGLFLLRKAGTRRAAVCVLGLLTGFAWCRGYEALFLRPLERYAGQELPFAAEALAAPQQTTYGQSCEVRLKLGGQSCTAVLYFDEADADIRPGDTLSGLARITTAQERLRRGSDYDISRGLLLSASCRGTLHIQAAETVPLRLLPARFAQRLRSAVTAVFPADTAGFVRALLLGDRSGLRYAARNELAIAGIYHAVAVSGMHVSILLGMILLLCGGNHPLAAALGLPAAACFILMAGAPASAVRAGVMQAIVLCAPLLRRDYDPPTAIFAALLVLLAQNPWAVRDVGLQLSFASTAGIVLFAGRLYRALTDHRRLQRWLRPKTPLRWLLRAMLTALCCTLSSTVFALPITAVQFGEISLAAPVVNVLVLWLLSIVFCGAMLTALLALALPAAAAIPAAVFLYALVLLLALRPGTVRLWHALAAAVVVTGCCMALSCADAALPASSFAMLDVGQGQCLVSRTGGSVTVIDCGGAEDASGETAARYLLARGMPRVDRLILTHFDADHCNGVRQLLRRVQVDTLYIPELSPSSRLRTQILLAAAEAGTSIRYVTQDLVLPQEGGSLTIFAPTGEKDEENAGLCVLAACEKYDILITGDLTAQAEYRLLSLHTLPQAAVLVAGHHGAATSTSGALLRAVRPEAVFISAGADNRFGHPAAQTLARIRQSSAAVYRTDLSGTITIRG